MSAKGSTKLSRQDQVKEIIRCGSDPQYFINKYVQIVHLKKGVVPFKTYPFQDDCLQAFLDHRFVIVNKSRQLGLSTVSAAYVTWMGLFQKNKNILVIATDQKVAMSFLKKVILMFESLPEWLVLPKVASQTKTHIEWTNGSRVEAAATSDTAGRGSSVNVLLVDEAAHITGMEDLWAALFPTVSDGGNIILLSTPFGVGNLFHKIWMGAKAQTNEFYPIELPWTVHPDRDEDWFEQQKSALGSDRLVSQELLCDFASSGKSFLNGEEIRTLEQHTMTPIAYWEGKPDLWIWRHPNPGERYLITSDVSRGDAEDFSTFHIVNLDQDQVVGEFQGKLQPDFLGVFLDEVGRRYNNALICVENNGVGVATAFKLKELKYPNLYYHKFAKFGIHTTFDPDQVLNECPGFGLDQKNRVEVLAYLDQTLRNQKLRVFSQRFFEELKTFVWIDNTRAKALKGYHDDLVMCYDEKTKVLTSDGWKNFHEVKEGDKVPSLNLVTKEIEEATNLQTVVRDYSGSMVQFDGRSVNLLVTPNHNMIVAQSLGANQYKDLEFVRADSLETKHFKMTRVGRWFGTKFPDVVLPATTYKNGRKREEHIISSTDFLLLLGFYISEGSGNKNRLLISQMRYSKGFPVIRDLLDRIGLSYAYRDSNSSFEINEKRLASRIKGMVSGLCSQKRIPREVLGATPEQLESLFQGLMLGDGYFSADGKPRIYVSTSRELCDDVLELCLKTGRAGLIGEFKNTLGRPVFAYKAAHRCYWVSISNNHLNPRLNHHGKTQVKQVPYTGSVSCLSLDKNHSLFVQREGKACWSGNSLAVGCFLHQAAGRYTNDGENVREVLQFSIRTSSMTLAEAQGWGNLPPVYTDSTIPGAGGWGAPEIPTQPRGGPPRNGWEQFMVDLTKR